MSRSFARVSTMPCGSPHRRSIQGSRARGNGKDQSRLRAGADSSRPPKESLLWSSTRYARFPGGPVLADRSVPSQLHMGNGNGSVAWLFTRQSAAQLRPFQFEPISKEPGAAAGRGRIRAILRCSGRLTRRESSWCDDARLIKTFGDASSAGNFWLSRDVERRTARDSQGRQKSQ